MPDRAAPGEALTADLPPALAGDPAPDTCPQKMPSLWRCHDYLALWTGDAVSSLGTSMSQIAYPLLILFATGSVARAGLITSASMIGTLITTLWGGALADRVSRKALLVVGPLVQGAAVGTVALFVAAGHEPMVLLSGAACLGGLAGGFHSGARIPAMRRIVPKEQMAVASSQVQGRDMAAQLFGSPIGAFLFTFTRWLPFGADAVSFLFASLGAALIRRPLGPEPADHAEQPSMLADIGAGLRFVRAVPFLRFLAVWAPAINMIANGFFLLFIAVLKYRGASPTMIGFATSIALVGGVTGAVAGPLLLSRVRAKLVFLSGGWILAACILVTAFLPAPWEIGLAIFAVMMVVVPLNASLDAYEVRIVPDEYSGRVSSAMMFGSSALTWAGPLLAGVLADAVGPTTAIVVFGLAIVPLAAIPHAARSLNLLNTPVGEVQEHPVPAAAAAGGRSRTA
jgi:MFS family permease